MELNASTSVNEDQSNDIFLSKTEVVADRRCCDTTVPGKLLETPSGPSFFCLFGLQGNCPPSVR